MVNRRGAGMFPAVKFGNLLRKYREHVGLTLDRLGERMGYTGSFIGQVERAERPPLREVAERADKALGTGTALTWLWDELLKDKIFFPEWFDWPDYEARATILRTFQLSFVYGLLQTEDYAGTLLAGDTATVTARMSRQSILTRKNPSPPRVYCLLAEHVLHYRIGSVQIMRTQLERLLAPDSSVNVQIVPDGTVHPGQNGAFDLATLDDASDVAYVETTTRGLTLTGRDDVKAIVEAFEEIRSLALPTNQSRELIARTVEVKWT